MNQTFLKILLVLSVLFSVLAVVWILARIIRRFFNKGNTNSQIVWYLLLFVVSIWCLRYSVGYYSVFHPNEYITPGLTKYEEIFNSFVHTFQSFSMDEDYTQYISAGKDMIKAIFDGSINMVTAFGIFASVLNVLAPICGGAILLDILQGAFPKVKLFINRLFFWKTKYYFSELNDGSLASAKSILNQKHKLLCRPIIIFTDVYTDGENEKSSELLKRAKAIGGICINDDLTHINHRFTSKKEYWLIDENEMGNIEALAELSNDKHYKSIQKTIIRIFYHDDSYALTEKAIVEQIAEKFKYNDKKTPAVIRTRCYQNLIYNLLKKEPLYAPLLECEEAKALDIAILGNGNIGTEMLLSASWCGQLYDVPLSINVVAQDEPEAAVAKINKISKEILDSTKPGNDVLRVYRDKEIFNDPYFTFRYCKSDVDCDDISKITLKELHSENPVVNKDEPKDFYLVDANYYFVALGDDAVNIRVAERLLKAVMQRQKQTNCYKKITIAYVVYDSHLCEVLNNYYFDDKGIGKIDECIKMVAVGSIDETFSYENIVDKKYMSKVLKRNSSETKITYSEWVKLCKERAITGKPYEFWSDYARDDIHYDYKVFSAFQLSQNNTCSWSKWKECHKECICESADEPIAKKLAWLEHRRWNAYLRSIGYKYYEKKDVKLLQTHDCLVEHHKFDEGIDGCHDFLEEVNEKKPHIIDYDFDGIIPKELYEKIISDK